MPVRARVWFTVVSLSHSRSSWMKFTMLFVPFLEHDYELIITGHSLGGGWAGLAGADFKFKGYNPLVITYAALKQGNKQYNEFVDSMFGTSSKNLSIGRGRAFESGDYVRVWSHYDIIPRLPPTDAYTNGGL